MKKIRRFACLLLVCFFPFALSSAQAQQSLAPAAQTATQAQTPVPANILNPAATTAAKPAVLTPLPLAPLASQLGQTLQTLIGVPSAQPSPTGATAATDSEDTNPQIGDSFANDILETLAKEVEALKADSANLVTTLSGLPDFSEWLAHQFSDPRRQALWSAIGNDLLIIVGIPLLCSIAIALLFMPLRLRLKRERPQTVGGRVAVLLGLLALRVVPIILFAGASLLLLDQNETHRLPRYVVINIIYALTLGGSIRQILRGIFAPATDHLRLLSFTTPQATYAFRWFSAFSLMITLGYFFVAIANAVRMPLSAVVVFQNLLGLVLTVMAITLIFQTRLRVALILRGNKVDQGTPSFARALRTWLAHHWHSLTIVYLVISFAVTLLGIDNGIALMLRGTILTFIILVVSRLSFLALEHWTLPSASSSTLLHRQVLAFMLRPLIWVFALIAIGASWGFHFGGVIATASGQRVTNAFLTVALTLFVLTVIYEILNSSIDRHLGRRDTDEKAPVASARARTLLPMVRNTVFILFSGAAILTLLSAVGFNIAPVLAGAGVVGVAIGFGSQSLVKDFLTGLFIVVENTVAVGDIVTIGAFSGVVETISIRTIRLRDSEGTLHILPFSEVSKISNMSKGFAYALVNVEVAYDSDLDRVMEVLREIGAKMQEDPIFKRVILEPIEVFGVDKLGDYSITIQARIRTRPGKQWDIKRLLLLNIVKRFAKEGIEIPYPTNVQLNKNLPHLTEQKESGA